MKIKSFLLVFVLLIATVAVKAQTVFNVYVGEVYEGGELVSKGDEVGNKVIIDETLSKITTSSKDGYKNQIFKIMKKIPGERDITIYECEGKNKNGIYTIYIFIDRFYQTIDYYAAQAIKNKTGTYIRQYYR